MVKYPGHPFIQNSFNSKCWEHFLYTRLRFRTEQNQICVLCVQECRRQKKTNRANKRSIHFYIGFSLELFTVNTDTKILTKEKLRLIRVFHSIHKGSKSLENLVKCVWMLRYSGMLQDNRSVVHNSNSLLLLFKY